MTILFEAIWNVVDPNLSIHAFISGLLEKCFNAFYDSEVVSEEAFDEWAKSQDPEEQEGKGVCVNLVKSFMRWLKEAEVEEGETHT